MAEILSYNPYRDMHNDVQFSAMFFGKNIQNIPFFSSTQTSVKEFDSYGLKVFTFTGKERDSETGFSYFGARYYDSDILTGWLSVDPMADKYPGLSPYNYCAWNPIKLVDPDGEQLTDFKDKNGNLIIHTEDGSNAVFKLTGTNLTNEYFAFDGYSDQGGSNEISIQGLIAGAQVYALDNHIYCNQAVNFVGRTFVNLYNLIGVDVNGGDIISGNLCANPIMENLNSNQIPYIEKNSANISKIQRASKNGAFVVGTIKGHVSMVSTRNYDIIRYKNGVAKSSKYEGGKAININGSEHPEGLGPRKKNRQYGLSGAHAEGWYVIQPFKTNLKEVKITQ